MRTAVSLIADRSSSFVVTPTVVAHRGASGYRPEHTLASFRLALTLGADDIEVDVVPTRDGTLVARHDPELSLTTDVAEHPEFAERRTTRIVDGEHLTGWFVEDFLLEEVLTLTARERLPGLRWGSAAHDGRHRVATLDEVLDLVRVERVRRGRATGVLVELKHAAYYESRGLSLVPPLLAALRRHDVDHPGSRVTVMSFEPDVLQSLAGCTRVPIVQLVDLVDGPLVSRAGLASVGEYADGVGVHKDLVLGSPSVVRDAHREWLTVHVWTLRVENRFLSPRFRVGDDPAAPGDLAGEARHLLELGVDGLITDHPDLVIGARGARARPAGHSWGSRIHATT